MATYFKYAEREADSYINWAEIGKDMSEMITTENRIREEKKDAIDQASREYGNVLSEPPQGDHKEFNQWSLEFGSDAQQARLMQDQLLKSGQLKLKDYLVMRQNMTDGTDRALDLMKEYNAEYSRKMDRTKAEENQDLESWLMGEAEGFANFSQTKLYINPTDGTISVAKMVKGKDGVMTMSSNPNDFTTVNALRNRIKGTFDRFDVATNVGTYVASLGEEINTITSIKNKYQRGTITEILDITQRENFKDDEGVIQKFEDAETKMLESMLTNPYNISSILTNSVNFDPTTKKEYTYTWSEQEAKDNPNLILLKNDPKSNNPMPQFSDDQKKIALEHLRTQARLMYDKTEKTTVVGANEKAQTPEWKWVAALDAEKKQSLYQSWQDLYTGDAQSVKSATDAILGLPGSKEAGLVKIERGANGVTFTYVDPKMNRTIPFKGDGGNDKDARSWFKSGTEVFGDITDKDLNRFGKGSFSGYGITSESTRGTGESARDNDAAFNDYVLTQGYIGEDSPTNTANHLRDKFGIFGFTFSGDTTGLSDDIITITPKGGEPVTFKIDDQSQVGAIQAFLRDNAVFKERLPASGGAEGDGILGVNPGG
jgi:hypothetical protein